MGRRHLSRRAFLNLTSLTSFSLLPRSQVLAGLFEGGQAPAADALKTYRYFNPQNLLSLEFYFIYVEEKQTGGQHFLQRQADAKIYRESYMIVRLPQQHIAESNLSSEKLDAAASFYATTHISGYSFLVFEILFDKETLPLTVQSLLQWNDHEQFRLVVRERFDESIFHLVEVGAGADETIVLNSPGAENHYPLGYRSKAEGLVFSSIYYPKAYEKVRKSLGSTSYEAASPVTAIEVPYRIVLSPQLPDPDNYRFGWTFPDKGVDGTELWVATLFPEKLPTPQIATATKTIAEPKKKPAVTISRSDDPPQEMAHHGDNGLRLLLIGSPDYQPTRYVTGDPKPAECPKDKDMLPNSNDRSDLIDHYIKQKLKARAPKISFSPLGVSVDISFRNALINQTVKKQNTLYEWNQSISYGRDQQTEISRVVMEDCFGFKMLHVRKAKRQTYKGVSLLVYREYIAPLELEKDYTLYVNNKQINEYADPNWKCGSPFKKIEIADPIAKQITTIQQMAEWRKEKKPLIADLIEFGADPDTNEVCWETLLSFWPLNRNGEFVEWEFKATDWHDEVHLFKKKIHLLTSNLTFNSSRSEYDFPQNFDSEVRATLFPDFKANLLPFTETRDKINARLNDLTLPTSKYKHWVSILDKGEQILLEAVDYYTGYLEASLGDMEAKLRSFAGQIEDQAMEEWAIFKRKVLEQEQKILRVVQSMIGQAEQDLQRLRAATMTIPPNFQTHIDDCKKARQRLLDAIQLGGAGLLDKARTVITELRTHASYFESNTRTWEAKAISQAYAAWDKVLAYFETLQGDLLNAVIGFEQEYREFLEKLPGKLRNRIRAQLVRETENIRQAIDEIRQLEHKARGRIDMFNAKVGYAVYKVEEELDDIRRKLEATGGNWKETYETMRDKYQQKVNGELSKMETRYILLRGNIRTAIKTKAGEVEKKVLEFFDDYACFPQLHSAEVLVKNINDLVNREVPCKIRYAKEYVETQVNDFIFDTRNNVSRVFVEIKGDAKEYIKSAVKEVTRDLGIINPALAAEFITYLKDTRKAAESTAQDMLAEIQNGRDEWATRAESVREDLANMGREAQVQITAVVNGFEDIKKDLEQNIAEARNSIVLIGREAKRHFEQYRDWANVEGKAFFKGLEAKILGAIHLKDILGPGFELPKLNSADKTLYYRFLTNKLSPAKVGPFSFHNTAQGKPAQLMVFMEKPLTNPSAYKAWTRLSNFAVGIFEDRLMVEFDSLQVYSDQNVKHKVDVKISDVKFYKELAYLEALAKNIKIPGTGLTMGITAKDIFVKFAYSMPGISGGAFTFDNLRFGIDVFIPLPIGTNQAQMPIVARFAVNEPDDKFVVAAGIWGGKGHFVIEATPKYIRRIDAGIDFGGYLALSLGIARGEAFLMAGIRFVYLRDEMGEVDFMLYATISCGGSVTVFGFITISVIFLLGLKYANHQGRASLYGIASVTYSIKIGFFRKSFTLTFSRRLHGSEAGSAQNDLTYNDTVPDMHILPAVYRPSDSAGESIRQATYFDQVEATYLAKERKKRLRDQYDACCWLNMTRTYKFPVTPKK